MMTTFFARPKKVVRKKGRRSRNAQALVMLAEGTWNLGQARERLSEKRPRFQNGGCCAHAESAIDFESSRTWI
jgi:hypothetical protein